MAASICAKLVFLIYYFEVIINGNSMLDLTDESTVNLLQKRERVPFRWGKRGVSESVVDDEITTSNLFSKRNHVPFRWGKRGVSESVVDDEITTSNLFSKRN